MKYLESQQHKYANFLNLNISSNLGITFETLLYFLLFVSVLQADVEVTFEISNFEKAEVLDQSWTDPQILCSNKDASVDGSLGPFGLLVLASEGLQEYTAVFYRIYKSHNNKYVVLMCSDQSRFITTDL